MVLIPSPQDTVLSMLQTTAGMESVVKRGGPVHFADLPQIANEVGLEDADIAPNAHLDWLRDSEFHGGADAAVLVLERERWLSDIEENFRETGEEFPADLIVAATIDVPWANCCLVVPTIDVADPDTVMLFAARGEGSVLVPIAVTRGDARAQPLPQPCQLSTYPDLGCLSSGCAGTCHERRGRMGGVLVRIGCVCT